MTIIDMMVMVIIRIMAMVNFIILWIIMIYTIIISISIRTMYIVRFMVIAIVKTVLS